jgi:hypothetical protein
MNNPSGLMQVFNGAQELQKVVPGKSLIETSFLIADLDKGEEVALFDELKHNEEHLDGLVVRLYHYLPVAVILNELYNVWMVHRLDQMNLVLEYFLEGLEIDPFYLMPLDDFDSIKPIVLQRLCQLNPKNMKFISKNPLLGVKAFTNCL